MPRNRMSGADVKGVVSSLQRPSSSSLIGMRLSNVYQLPSSSTSSGSGSNSSKTFVMKLSKPDSEKMYLLIENGIRLHPTRYLLKRDEQQQQQTAAEQHQHLNGFVIKLRKHLRTKRLEQVWQLANDRIIILTFYGGSLSPASSAASTITVSSSTSSTTTTTTTTKSAIAGGGGGGGGRVKVMFHVVVELFDKGNIILCRQLLPESPVNNTTTSTINSNNNSISETTGGELELSAGGWEILDVLRKSSKETLVYRGREYANFLRIGGFYPHHIRELISLESSTTGDSKSIAAAAAAAAEGGFIVMSKEFTDFFDHEKQQEFISCINSATAITASSASSNAESESTPGGSGSNSGGGGGGGIFNIADKYAQYFQDYNSSTETSGGDSAAPTTTTVLQMVAGDSYHRRNAVCGYFEQLALEDRSTPNANSRRIEWRYIHPDYAVILDEYFSGCALEKLKKRQLSQRIGTEKKVEKIQRDHERQVEQFEAQIRHNDLCARLILANVDLVDACVLVVNSLLAQGTSWNEIPKLLRLQRRQRGQTPKQQQQQQQQQQQSQEGGESKREETACGSEETEGTGDKLAFLEHIVGLKLEENHIQLYLELGPSSLQMASQKDDNDGEDNDDQFKNANEDDEEETRDESEESTGDQVDVDISLTAHANARFYFEMKKKFVTKKEKSIEVATSFGKGKGGNVLEKAAEKKRKQLLAKYSGASSVRVQTVRKRFWFEKFNWFITSENYLIISGRDAHQNDILFKRYCQASDLFFHTTLPGSAATILKIPPAPQSAAEASPDPQAQSSVTPGRISLDQASVFSLAQSRSWSSKISIPIFWVPIAQVSKSAPSGQFLPGGGSGSFMIRGKRNIIRDPPMMMAFALMWRVDPNDVPARHSHERLRLHHQQQQQQVQLDTSTLLPPPPFLQGGDDDENDEAENEKRSRQQHAGGGVCDDGDDDSFVVLDDYSTTFGNANLKEKKQKSESKKQQMSIAERKRLKKQQKQQQQSQQPQQQQQQSQDENSSTSEPKRQQPKSLSQQQPNRRGKHGKMKKIKQKYADQDEEERVFRMRLLGHKVADPEPLPQPEEDEEEQADDVEGNEDQEEQTMEENVPEAEPEEGREAAKGNDDEAPKEDDGNDQQEEEEGAEEEQEQAKKPEPDEDEEDEIRKLLGEENAEPVNQEEQDRIQLSDIDLLTGCPHENDTLSFALPVCAPYDAVKDFKYKVKLVPGNLKRGKAARQVLDIFLLESKPTPREHELIREIPESDITVLMLPDVKILGKAAPSSGKHKGGGKSGGISNPKKPFVDSASDL